MHLSLDHCAALLRTFTDDLAAQAPRRTLDLALPDLIAHVRAVSTDAAARMRAALQAHAPDIGWRDEDDAHFDDTIPHWIYDPVDGAYHYVQGLPLWAASLTLVRDGRPVAAFVYDPVLRELFTASEDGGAWLDGMRLRVSSKGELAAAVVGSALPPVAQVGADAQAHALRLLGVAARHVFVVRALAAASLQLAYVAAGRLDVYWETGNDAADWLAGSLLVREAGGTVGDFDGEPLHPAGRGIVAGPEALSAPLRAVLGDAHDAKRG